VSRTRTIRTSLMGSYAVVVLLVAGLILGVTITGARSAAREQSGRLLVGAMERIHEHLDGFFVRVAEETLIVRDWAAAHPRDALDPARARQILARPLGLLRHVQAVVIADSTGGELRLYRSAGALVLEEAPAEGPRRADWFTAALDHAETAHRGRVHWSRPRVLTGSGERGLTASVPFAAPDGLNGVVALDVTLEEISLFTMSVPITVDAKVIVLMPGPGEEVEVIGLPRSERFATPEARRAVLGEPVEKLDAPVINDARRAALAAAGGRGALDEPLRFQSGGEAWWMDSDIHGLDGEARVLFVAVLIPEEDLLGTRRVLRWWILGAAVVAFLAALLFAAWFARRAGRPIEALVEGTERMRRGDFDAVAPIETRVEELRRLADAHDEMRVGLASLVKMERDIQVARRIQQATFPTEVPQVPGYRIAGSSLPADDTSGDTFDLIGVRRDAEADRWVICSEDVEQVICLLADATGHGIGPALSVAQLRAMVRMAVRLASSPDGIARHINEQLHADLPLGRFITAWVGRLDPAAHTLVGLSAGHGPILHYRAATGTVESHGSQMPAFGLFDAPEIGAPQSVTLEPGDIYAVLSDGFHEAHAPDGELFDEPRVEALLCEHAASTPDEILVALHAAVDAFTHGAPPDDDRTAIFIKRDA